MMRSVLIVGGTVGLGLALVGLWAWSSQPPAGERGPVTYEDSDPSDVELGELAMAVSENFVGDRIHIFSAPVTNRSDRPVRSIELSLTFQDFGGTPVEEFEGEALRSPLPPGETRTWEFRFESLPETWNSGPPTVSVSRIGH